MRINFITREWPTRHKLNYMVQVRTDYITCVWEWIMCHEWTTWSNVTSSNELHDSRMNYMSQVRMNYMTHTWLVYENELHVINELHVTSWTTSSNELHEKRWRLRSQSWDDASFHNHEMMSKVTTMKYDFKPPTVVWWCLKLQPWKYM